MSRYTSASSARSKPRELEALEGSTQRSISATPPDGQVPTLVMHGADDQIVPVEVGRYTAQQLRTARFVELPGIGHLALGGSLADRIQVEIEGFLKEVWQTGGWEEAEPERHACDRPLH